MPSYTFSVLHNGEMQRSEGQVLAGHYDARKIAQGFAGEMLKHGDPSVFEADLTVRVADSDGLTLFEIMIVGTDAAAANDREASVRTRRLFYRPE